MLPSEEGLVISMKASEMTGEYQHEHDRCVISPLSPATACDTVIETKSA